ncbi:MAG: glycerophosphodiester phosphodiesterase [Acidobacteriota bacterium]
MTFLILGHRGSPRRFPENTLPSFEEALRAGADGFETDLRLLADRAAVLFHDDEVGDEASETLTSAQLAADPLDALAPFAGRALMVLEVKRSQWEEILLEHIAAWPGIVVASFDHRAIAELARRKASFPLGLTFNGAIVDLPEYAKRIGATWIFPNYHWLDEEQVAALHAAGMTVIPWTPNRAREWQHLRDIGCDGIITDLPAEAVEWRMSSRA